MASTSKITINGVKYEVRDDVLREGISKKQDKLIAGEGIEITANEEGKPVIFVVGQE